MRVLVATVPATGHVLPLIPMARELQRSGDAVLWATGADQCEQLGGEGFTTAAVGPPMREWFERLAARTRGRPGDGIPTSRTVHWFAPRLFAEVGAALMVDELLDVAKGFNPDAVLFESRCYAAPAVARAVGAYPVLRAVTTLMPTEVEVLVTDAITPLWRELRLTAPTHAGVFDGLTFSAWPASLDDPSLYGELVVHRLRESTAPHDPPPWLQGWVDEQGSRPVVYATLGTVFGRNAPVLRAMLDGISAADVAVLMTVGHTGDPSLLGPLPPRARVERFVPQDMLLPVCSAVVSHGGSGTTLGALAHGLPHVMLPQGADQYINADVCVRAGLGRAVLPGAVTPQTVRAAVEGALADHTSSAAPRRVQAEMAGAMSVADAVEVIRDAVAATR